MISISSVLYILVLFSELSRHSVSVAMPAAKAEDGLAETDALGLVSVDETMNDPISDPDAFRRSLILDNNMRDEDGSPKIIIVSDMRVRGHGARGLNPVFSRGLSLLADRSLSHTPAERSLKIERRNTDIDMLRCMIGRVYRPCWEI